MTFPLDYASYSAQHPAEQLDWFDKLAWESIAQPTHEKSIRRFLENVYETDESTYTKLKAIEWYSELTLGRVIPMRAASTFLFDVDNPETFIQLAKLKYLFLLFGDESDVYDVLVTASDNEDVEIASEAYYRRGLLHLLYRAGQSDELGFLREIEQARNLFNQAVDNIQNRVDALFFSLVTQCIEELLAVEQEAYQATFKALDSLLRERIIWSRKRTGDLLEWHIYRSLCSMRAVAEHTSRPSRWLEWRDSFSLLAKYANDAVALQSLSRQLQKTYEQFTSTLVPFLLEEYYVNNLSAFSVQLAELLIKLEDSDPELSSFLITISSSIEAKKQKKSLDASVSLLAEFRLACPEVSVEQILADLSRVRKSVDSDEAAYYKLALRYKRKDSSTSRTLMQTGFPAGDEVLNLISAKIKQKVPGYPELSKNIFLDILRDLINFAFNAETGDRQEYAIYYDSSVNKEKVFQKDLYNRLRTTTRAHYYRMEMSNMGSGGRMDIVYEENNTLFPIEVKRESTLSTWEEVERNYVPQAQMYTTPYNQLGFLVIFDISSKTVGPLPDIRDRVDILQHKPVYALAGRYPDYIVGIIIPANRVVPSALTDYKS